MKINLPDGYRGFRVADVLRSVIDVDQYDDWIADPICYQDLDQAAVVAASQAAIRSREVDAAGATAIEIHSLGGRKFTAAYLPLPFRVVLADVIASQARPLQRRLVADKTFGFEYLPPGVKPDTAPYWTIDYFAEAAETSWQAAGMFSDDTGAPTDENQPLFDSAHEQRDASAAPSAVFGTGEDGTYTVLSKVAELCESAGFEGLAFRWYDIESFADSVPRKKLLEWLQSAGWQQGHARFYGDVLNALATRPDGFVSVDDANGFLLASYLAPIDDWLRKGRVLFFRCRDEYFVFEQLGDERAAQGFDVAAFERDFDRELGKLGLKRRQRVVSFNLDAEDTRGADDDETAILADALLKISWETTDAVTRYRFAACAPAWLHLCSRIAATPDSAPQLSAVFELLRLANFGRRSDCLLLPSETAAMSERGRNYRNSLDAQTAMLARLRHRLTASAVSPWEQHWILRLLTDVSTAGAPEIAFAHTVLSKRDSVQWYVWAQAAVLFFRHATATDDVRRLAEQVLRPSGQVGADRFLAMAAYFAELRLGLAPARLDAFAGSGPMEGLAVYLRNRIKERGK
ncbi:MAG: hypothetical protein IPK26_13200 [Planctomycetes bacterium]|nr:hypothetical protein [Planctomycetota bacterium]